MVSNSLRKNLKRNLCQNAEDIKSISSQSTDKRWTLEKFSETIALGESLIYTFSEIRLLLLKGDLGAGKTTLVKGIAKGLGINEPITSPTFPLAQHYSNGESFLFHLDLYRLEISESANEIFLQEEEEAKQVDALMVIEWPERLNIDLPEAWRMELFIRPEGGRLAQLQSPELEEIKLSTSLQDG